MASYPYTKALVDPALLAAQINADAGIPQDTTGVTWNSPDTLTVLFASVLDQSGQDALAAVVSAHDASQGSRYRANHYKRTPANGPIQKEEWYETIDAQAGTLSGLAKRITYTTVNGKITQYAVEVFFRGGTVASTETYKCWLDSGNNYIEEKVM